MLPITASKGSNARMGITARSWKSNTEMAERPPLFLRSPFSERVCNTMAVEESDRISPMAAAWLGLNPIIQAAPAITSVVVTTCIPPIPKIECLVFQSREGCISSPMRKSIRTTPNSAKCITFSLSWPTHPNT